jgi:DNA excision repair protein ERCC-3
MWQYKFQAPLGFGSRQEEAQQLGRILSAFFYTLVSKDTKDQDFGAKRQLSLTVQGYRYVIRDVFMDNEDEGRWY